MAYSKLAFTPALVAALLVIAAGSARADITYYYTGNTFNDLRNGNTCPPVCNVSGWFTVASAFAPDMALTSITPVSFSLTSGLVTLTSGDPTGSSLYIGTDATGAIDTWSWVELGPDGNIAARILTEDVPATVADDSRFGDNTGSFVGFAGPIAGIIQNDPGAWSTPEPSLTGYLAGLIAMTAIGLRLARARSPKTGR